MNDYNLGDYSPTFGFLQQLYLLTQLHSKNTRITIAVITGLVMLAFAGWLVFDPIGATTIFNNSLHFLAQQEVKQFLNFGTHAARKYRLQLVEYKKLLNKPEEK